MASSGPPPVEESGGRVDLITTSRNTTCVQRRNWEGLERWRRDIFGASSESFSIQTIGPGQFAGTERSQALSLGTRTPPMTRPPPVVGSTPKPWARSDSRRRLRTGLSAAADELSVGIGGSTAFSSGIGLVLVNSTLSVGAVHCDALSRLRFTVATTRAAIHLLKRRPQPRHLGTESNRVPSLFGIIP